MAAKNSLLNMALCLTAVCLLCAAILGVVYGVTSGPISAAADKSTIEAINEVLPDGGKISKTPKSGQMGELAFEYYEMQGDSSVVAYAVKSAANGFGGELLLMVGVLPDGTIWKTKVLSHSETPGLGAKCTTDEAFISQWHNYNGSFTVKADGGDIDAITASTITSRAYTLAVKNASDFVKSLAPAVEEELEETSEETHQEEE